MHRALRLPGFCRQHHAASTTRHPGRKGNNHAGQKRGARYTVPAVLAAVMLGGTSTSFADNWPSWRGLEHNGVSFEKRPPIEWSETKNIAWKITLPGMGGSTPVIWNDRIFLTSGR